MPTITDADWDYFSPLYIRERAFEFLHAVEREDLDLLECLWVAAAVSPRRDRLYRDLLDARRQLTA